MFCSYYTYWAYKEQGEEAEVVVMQPNINPYTCALIDTGEVLSTQERVECFIKLSEKQLTPKTQFLVWPEIAIDSLLDEQILSEYPLVDRLVSFKQSYPQLSLLSGLNSLVGYGSKKATKTARFSHRHGYYDIFNTALFVGNQGTLATYHKSKLVPGVEIVPYMYSLEVPKILTPDLRGKLSSLGMQDHPSVFFNREGMGVAPMICYESVYGDYLAEFVRMGASLIFSITIDGWWENTPGYQQHFHYTRLRAIESRRSVARSALKGISAFINQRGDILQAARYEDQAVIRHTLQANTTLTFYIQHSNYIANVALWTSLFLIIGAMLIRIFTKNKQGRRTLQTM
jgi:apolipoprotein N-acyltransferase